MIYRKAYLTPKKIYEKLNKYIIGQNSAKKIVSIAIRNRWRTQRIQNKIKYSINCKNIILKGPTGSGKTEMIKCLSKLIDSPLYKVASTKFTEIGYVGKDVESIITDLLSMSIKICINKYLDTLFKSS